MPAVRVHVRVVLTRSVSFLFEFLEGCIFLEFLDVVSQVRFFLFDLFFFDRARSLHRRLVRMLGHDYELVIWIHRQSVVLVFLFRCFAAEHCSHIHLVQALLFAVPVAGNFVHSATGTGRLKFLLT